MSLIAVFSKTSYHSELCDMVIHMNLQRETSHSWAKTQKHKSIRGCDWKIIKAQNGRRDVKCTCKRIKFSL